MAKKLNEDKLVSKANSLVELKPTDLTDLSDEQTKHNPLIELKRYKLGLEEFKLMSIYCAKINPLDTKTREVTFPVREFLDAIGCDAPVQTMIPFLKRKTFNLLHNLVQINRPRPYLGYTQIVLFTFCDVSQNKENGEWYITLNTNEKALPLFFDLKSNYISYKLRNILYLKSLNQLRMYEILKENQYKKQFDIKLSDLREMIGIKPEEHARWADLQRYVLKPCQQALKEHTDISFEYEVVGKIGKKINVLRFNISDNMSESELLKQLQTKTQPQIQTKTTTHVTTAIPTITSVSSVPPPKHSKKDYTKHPLWIYAIVVANEKHNIDNVQAYAVGILKNWDKAGYTCVEDLIRADAFANAKQTKHTSRYTRDKEEEHSFDLNDF